MGDRRTRLHPDVAATRGAVRRRLSGLTPAAPVVVALSGGADSLALVAAVLFEGRAADRSVSAVVVDHGLQDGSGAVAAAAADQGRMLGASSVEVVRVEVGAGPGPEAAARQARYAALHAAADRLGAAAILLGHTRDDQAETVLLGLARGSGTRSMAGMRAVDGRLVRPFLELSREQTEAACRAQNIGWWVDPHNADPAFARVRVRTLVLPLMEDQLGPGVRAALARTAALAGDDADLLDDLAGELAVEAQMSRGWSVEVLAAAPAALRTRVLRAAALSAGCPATALTHGHVMQIEVLVMAWTGQRGIDLPGRVRAVREGSAVLFVAGGVAG